MFPTPAPIPLNPVIRPKRPTPDPNLYKRRKYAQDTTKKKNIIHIKHPFQAQSTLYNVSRVKYVLEPTKKMQNSETVLSNYARPEILFLRLSLGPRGGGVVGRVVMRADERPSL